jgi:hypothetical protein
MAAADFSLASITALTSSTLVLYAVNSLSVSIMSCLIQGKPFRTISQLCNFRSVPYYLVGAAAAGIKISTFHASGWQPALIVFPTMALIHISYRAHMAVVFSPSRA